MKTIEERSDVDCTIFAAEIVNRDTPVVIRGLLRDWPLVRAARASIDDFADQLRGVAADIGGEVWIGAGEERFVFAADFVTLNHDRRLASVAQLLDLLLRQRGAAAPYAMFAGALPVSRFLPSFRATHPMPLLDDGREMLVSLWLGNRTRTAAHFDVPHNLACVVAGRRRFTLFPTEQARNLYIGPLDVTLAGQPSSIVDVEDPDLTRFPRFEAAADAGLSADLEPGDAIYIPSLWWHAVRSLDEVGAMVNYWWRDQGLATGPYPALLHAVAMMATLPDRERKRWHALFDHFAFDQELAGTHLPAKVRASGMTEEVRQRIIRSLGGKP